MSWFERQFKQLLKAQAWTPTLAGGGALTWTSTSATAKSVSAGDLVLFDLAATGTAGGTAAPYVTFTLPGIPVDLPTGFVWILTGGAYVPGYYYNGAGSTTCTVFRMDGTNLSNSGALSIFCRGFYRIV